MSAEFHDLLKPLSWLFGKWKAETGEGQYPTIKDFQYGEVAEFSPIPTKPIIQYSMLSYEPKDGTPIHREIGFIHIKPDSNQISFVIAHHMGTTEIQEGEVFDKSLVVQSINFHSTTVTETIPPPVIKMRRTLTLKGDNLESVLDMETEKSPMTEHLRITFVRN